MKRSLSWIAVLPSLVVPLCIGLSLYLALSVLIDQGHLSHPMLVRYVTGHPISQVTVTLFFIGLVSLAGIGRDVIEQFLAESRIRLSAEYSSTSGAEDESAPESTVEPALDCTHDAALVQQACCLATSLDKLPKSTHHHYLWQRLHAALQHVQRTRSTGAVDDELKYLSELDQDRQQQRYALVRILIWATPMLGFLGTVLGISDALGGINVGPENDFQDMMNGLRGSLYVAFDTTALALTLSMLLMFVQFLVDRFECQLLGLVDQRARHEIATHLDLSESRPEIQEMADRIQMASERSIKTQLDTWRQSLRAAEQAWSSSLTDTHALVQANLAEALQENLARMSDHLGKAIERADSAMGHRWQQWQVTLSENARSMTDVQKLLSGQLQLIQDLSEDHEQHQRWESLLTTNQEAAQATAALRVTLEEVAQSIARAAATEAAASTPLTASPAEEVVTEDGETILDARDEMETIKRPKKIASVVADLSPSEVSAIEALVPAEHANSPIPSVHWPGAELDGESNTEAATSGSLTELKQAANVPAPQPAAPDVIRFEPRPPALDARDRSPESSPEIILEFPSEVPPKAGEVDRASQRAEQFLSLRRTRRSA